MGNTKVSELLEKTEVAEVNNVETRDFPLSQTPVSYQLTIHVTNMIAQYGNRGIASFKEALQTEDAIDIGPDVNFRAQQIIEHYGREVVQNWFTDIYGWTFKKVA